MNIFAIISLSSFLIYVYLGTVVYLKQPENALNRTFFIYTLIAVYTCFTDFQMRISESFITALFWFRIGSLWHLLLSALMHFVFVLNCKSKRRRDYLIYIPLYLIGLLFAFLDYSANQVLDGPKPSPWGWSYGTLQQTLIGDLYLLWCSSLIMVGIFLCLRLFLNAGDVREKQQAKYILIGTAIPMVAGGLEMLFSRLGMEIPNLLQSSLVIGSGFWAFAIWKYELFVLSPVTTVKEIIQTMSDMLFLLSPSLQIKVVNQAAVDLLGYSREEMIDHPIRRLFDKRDYKQVLNGPVANELAQRGIVSDAETTVRAKDGRKISISLAGSLVRDKNMQFQGIALLGRDITRRKLQEQELQRYQEKLEEVIAARTAELEKTYAQLQRAHKLEFMGTIAGGVAHDLNNILSGIMTYPELLLLDLPQESPLRKPLVTIQRSGEKATTIVADLLTLARREVVVKSVVNLNLIVKEYLLSPERAKMQSYHPDTQIVTDLDPKLPNILGSPVHLSKTLMNLVHNGVEAMPGGGILRIATRSGQVREPISGYEKIEPGNYVLLSVSDPGTGIAAADIERIFEPFYTKKKMGKSGTGLGMAVVWGTLKDHGGYVDVLSQEGRGTTFTLYFPASNQPEAQAPARVPIEDYKGKGETVLVVDDVAEQREIACGILAKLAYNSSSVSSGEAAVAYLKREKVDILLLDMIMNGGIDGLETYKRILRIRPHQRAIIASGFSQSERVKEAETLGVGCFVQKPYSIERLGLAIRTELDKAAPGN